MEKLNFYIFDEGFFQQKICLISGSFVQRQKLTAIYHVKKLVKDSQ